MHQVTLVAARTLTPTVRELTFRPEPALRFVAGQWVSLRLPQPGGEVLARAYSIASSPRADGTFDVAVTLVEKGPGSTYLHAMQPGEVLVCTQAQGFFTLEPFGRPALFVGTGTGVSPLRAMLHAARTEDESTASRTLLLGVRTEADLLYGEDFRSLEEQWPSFRFVPTLSRPGPGWTGLTGYVQTHLASLLAGTPDSHDVYLCGLNRMLKESRAVLKEQLGYTRQRIHTERYD